MANPTTNYGFVMPTNTDLVKDLPADFDVFGQAVDTTIKNLNPETTLGDISYRSSTANTNTRLAIGTSGQVLTVSGGVPAWSTPTAGALTSLASGTLSSTAVNLTSIDQTYVDLYLVVSGAYFVTTNSQCVFRFNSDSGTSYNQWFALLTTTTPIVESGTYLQTTRNNVGTATNTSVSTLLIRNYASSTAKFIEATFSTISDTGTGTYWSFNNFESATAISSISILPSNGTSSFGGGTYTLYGAK